MRTLFVSHCSPINLFEGRKSTLLPGPLLKQKIKSEFSELLEQKITLNGSKLCWMAKGRLAGVPVLSPVTPQEVTLPASCIPVPDPPGAADCRVLAASPLAFQRDFLYISATSFSFQLALIGTITTWTLNYSITKSDTRIIWEWKV